MKSTFKEFAPKDAPWKTAFFAHVISQKRSTNQWKESRNKTLAQSYKKWKLAQKAIYDLPTQKPSITVEPILNGHPQTGGN